MHIRWQRMIRRFQSTLPARGATAFLRTASTESRYFNPRSPHGERPPCSFCARRSSEFQSTLPARGATALCCVGGDATDISIHAPRTGSDRMLDNQIARTFDFNPRSPHGERHVIFPPRAFPADFNPRSPHGERHFAIAVSRSDSRISIHAPRTGSDDLLSRRLFLFTISIHAPRTGSDSAK